MSDSVFNPDLFLATATDQAGDTRFSPVPIGEWRGQCKSVTARRNHSEKTGLDYTFLDVQWTILDDEVRQQLNMEEPTVRQSFILDLTAAGGLDFGRNRNIRLNRLREAVGKNTPGKSWRPSDLEGSMARIRVVHRVREDTGEPTAEVNSVAAL